MIDPGFAIIGPGRAGSALARALSHSTWRNDGVYHRQFPSDLTSRTDTVILAVPDEAIVSVAKALVPGSGVVLHLSGATGLDVLAPHPAGSVHPLMSLPDADTGARRLLGGATFTISGHPRAAELVAQLGGTSVEINDDQRALYHSTAAIAANHLVALCAQVNRLAQLIEFPCDPFWELMETTLANVRAKGPLAALTGPAARGDLATLRRHVEALPAAERDLYRLLATEAGRLAGRAIEWNPEDCQHGHTRTDHHRAGPT